ncbi:thiamine-phosphate kinase [Candidatus Roizmanbacteria bacterium]|nr:thiamine-phosphate kinase [Candidatus Roizmanbacteria bacterium]
MNEFQLIDKIKSILKNDLIGDDTAPIKIGDKTLLLTNDILLEGRHFLNYFPQEFLGWKAISVNVSDIVASGGKPKYALVSLLLPKNKITLVEPISRQIKKACQYYDCQVVGGNITGSEKLGLDVFMIGETKKFIGRRQAKPGDNVYLTGPIGDSRAGLKLLTMKKKPYESFEKILIEKHLKPVINLNHAKYLSQNATSSIDVSDGLSSDIYHLANSSQKKIIINSEKIPLSRELKLFCKKYRFNPIDFALKGGEDYQVLLTQNGKSQKTNDKLILIGKVYKGSGVFLDKNKLKDKSFDHFSPS